MLCIGSLRLTTLFKLYLPSLPYHPSRLRHLPAGSPGCSLPAAHSMLLLTKSLTPASPSTCAAFFPAGLYFSEFMTPPTHLKHTWPPRPPKLRPQPTSYHLSLQAPKLTMKFFQGVQASASSPSQHGSGV